MKKAITYSLLVVSTFSLAQSYEIYGGRDTINKIDVAGKKQGKWILTGKHKPGTCYAVNQKAEEGGFTDNRKSGNWMEYYCNGNMKSNVPFQNGRPDGYAIMYYENGNKKEEGQWKINRWVGNYKLYYENGQVQHDFKFNEGGKRDGVQTYKYENGQTAIEGSFANGKESGVIKEYYETGDTKAVKTFNNGEVDVASIKTFEPVKAIAKTDAKPVENAPSKAVTEIKKDEVAMDAKPGANLLNGKHIVYNKNKQVSKDGVFKDSRLIDGKAYIYDDNGILTRVAIYKNGIYAGDGQIEN
jgi:antitoxin component YwqK of YwqJK toxin-antitoxin module